MTQLFFSEYHADIDLTLGSARPLVIVGAGGLGREIAVLVAQINEAGGRWELQGFYDDRTPAWVPAPTLTLPLPQWPWP
jgi:hypothetical protein